METALDLQRDDEQRRLSGQGGIEETMRKFRRLVLEAKQSPLNQRQWFVRFACGHELWLTQKTKPSGSKTCGLCRAHDVLSRTKAK